MALPTADEDEGGVRHERVEPGAKGRVRDALHIGVEIPAKFVIGLLLVGAFNGGIMWVKFDALIDSTKTLQSSHQAITTNLTKVEQHNGYQDEKIQDHEHRIRTVERTKP